MLTIFRHIEMFCWVHRDNVDVGFEQLEDLIQLFPVTVTVNEDLKLGISSLGFSWLDVHQIYMLLLFCKEAMFSNRLTKTDWLKKKVIIPKKIFCYHRIFTSYESLF